MTPQELNERIDIMFAITKELTDGSPDKEPAKQLIRDCIEAVLPKDSETQNMWAWPAEDVIDDIKADTKELLG